MSNSQTWAETFAPIEARNRNIIYYQTWGHLAPVKNTSYKCKILFIVSAYNSGTKTVVDTCLGNSLQDSPWFYDSMIEYLDKFTLDAGVYIIDGSFRNIRFYGNPKKVLSINDFIK